MDQAEEHQSDITGCFFFGMQAIVYAGLVVAIYAVAFVLYMLFEAPFAAVFHILYNRNFK